MKCRKSANHGANAKEWLSLLKEINDLFLEYSPALLNERPSGSKRRLSKSIFASLFEVYAETLGYYVKIQSGSKRIKSEELHIARLWQKFGTRIERFDQTLGNRLKAKSAIWSTDALWSKPVIQKAWALLNEIRANANLANPEDPETRRMIGLAQS